MLGRIQREFGITCESPDGPTSISTKPESFERVAEDPSDSQPRVCLYNNVKLTHYEAGREAPRTKVNGFLDLGPLIWLGS